MKILFVPDKLSTIFLIDFFIMDLIVIAQLITSAATLIVASILIWQMLIQKKTLDIAHKDADNDFSVQVVSERNAMRRWFTDKLDPEFEKKLKLGLDWFINPDHAPIIIADKYGYFKDEGLDVEIIQGNAGINIPRLLAAKEIEFGIGSNSFVPLNMLSNGIPAKAVMASFQKDPQVIMTHYSSSIKNLNEMLDKPIMISENSIGAFWVWLKSKYLFNDKQIRRKTFSLAPFLVNQDAILQGYLTSEPYLVEKELGKTPKIFLLSDYGFPGYGAMILARNDIIESKPEVVRLLLRPVF